MKKKPTETIEFLPEDGERAQRRLAADTARWKRNKVSRLPVGFSSVDSGRAITIYLREGKKFMEFSAEFSGVPGISIVVFPSGSQRWINVDTFESEVAEGAEQRAALNSLENWLKQRGTTYSLIR